MVAKEQVNVGSGRGSEVVAYGGASEGLGEGEELEWLPKNVLGLEVRFEW